MGVEGGDGEAEDEVSVVDSAVWWWVGMWEV